jgi:hypothetical protein
LIDSHSEDTAEWVSLYHGEKVQDSEGTAWARLARRKGPV